jgi:group I intron endonuclease
LSSLALGRIHLDSTKDLISQALTGYNNPFYNKKHSLNTNKLISSRRSKNLIYIYDSLFNLQIVFSSLTSLAKSIKANNSTLSSSIINSTLFRGN